NGAGVIVSQYYGAGRFDNMKRVITAIIWISAAVNLIISFIGVTFVTLFLRVLSVPEKIIDYAADYLRILYLFAAGCGLITQDAKLDKTLTREEADSICRNSKI
ncbi:MAG TPA: MATE family efflux transporter, partial [Treponemataceae bacterium]|nr:MATE family efflux transporter [Treponemataceae bacterium]